MWHHDRQRKIDSDRQFAEYLDDFARQRMDRRTIFRRGGIIGLSLAAIGGLCQARSIDTVSLVW